MDGLGELVGAPGAAAELAEDPPGLELRVRTLAGCAELRVRLIGLFLRFRLVPALVRDFRVRGALIPLIGEGDQVTYRHAVVVPTPNPAASSANVSPLRR